MSRDYTAEEFTALLLRQPKTFYVYELLDSNGESFYVGKGKVNRHGSIQRALNHEADARKKVKTPQALHIRRLWRKGLEVRYSLVWTTNQEHQALFHEQVVIGSRGRIAEGGTLVNRTAGGQGMSGYIIPDSVRRKMSKTRRGRKQSPEHNKAISEGRKVSAKVKASSLARQVPVKIYGKVYDNIGDAAEDLGVCRATLYWRLNRNWDHHERLK